MVRPAGCAVPEAAGLAPVAAAMSPLTPAAVAGSRQEGEYLAEQVPSLGVAGAEDGKLGKPTLDSSSDRVRARARARARVQVRFPFWVRVRVRVRIRAWRALVSLGVAGTSVGRVHLERTLGLG